jgi:hypothetical protein
VLLEKKEKEKEEHRTGKFIRCIIHKMYKMIIAGEIPCFKK